MQIHINEQYWSAWKRYGWDKDIPGIGFRKTSVDMLADVHEKIRLTIGKDRNTIYEIAAVTIRNLAEKHNSLYEARHRVLLYVIPQNKLRKIWKELFIEKQQKELK